MLEIARNRLEVACSGATFPIVTRRSAPIAADLDGRRLTDHTLLCVASALFVLPSVIFATSFRPWAAAIVGIGGLVALALVVVRPRGDVDVLAAPLRLDGLLVAIASAAAILVLGGETHLFFPPADWLIRDAVLGDLVQHGFAVDYAVDGKDYLLRAPLGMYVVPALVGRWAGIAAAHATLLAQNAFLLGTIFYLLARSGRGWPHVALMIVFAGMPIIAAALGPHTPQSWAFYMHWSLDAWHPMFQYSSSIVQFFWVPNHALPGWWLATLLLLGRRARLDIASVGITVAAFSFWSPLAILPAVPVLCVQAVGTLRATLSSPRLWIGLAGAACFAPLLLFMTAASGTIAHGASFARPDFPIWYALFVLIELPPLAVVIALRARLDRDLRLLVVISSAVLLALPFFRFGPGNDLVMRGSITALTIIAFAYAEVLLALAGNGGLRRILAAVLVVLTVPSAAIEIWRAVALPSYPVSACSVVQAQKALAQTPIPSNYLALRAAMPAFVAGSTASTAATAAAPCWPDSAMQR